MVAITPIFIITFINSDDLTEIFCANSLTVIASGISISFFIGSVGFSN